MNGKIEVQPEMSFLGTPAVIRSSAMQQLMQRVPRIAQSGAAVLVTGESGVGKEIVSKAIHQHSLRCSRAWVDVNCGALPEHLVESELFGYEKGAFSGAEVAKKGLFELAHDGTLFLEAAGRRIESLTARRILLATGALERPVPIPGWTLPGAYSLGAAQVALKYQGCGIGRRVADNHGATFHRRQAGIDAIS